MDLLEHVQAFRASVVKQMRSHIVAGKKNMIIIQCDRGSPGTASSTDEELENDPCIACMREGTDEARKVIRNGGSIWHAVYRKRDPADLTNQCISMFE